MVTPEEIDRLISCPHEDEHLEFKEAKEQFDFDKLCRYCAAIGNEGGGVLLLGISDTHPRRVVGTNSFLNIEKIQHQIYAKLKFPCDYKCHHASRWESTSFPNTK